MERINRIKGCLYGGAAGDALGYTIEFISLDMIKSIYGNAGIREYVLSENGEAVFSDDTQMTLFTCEGLINSADKYENATEKIYDAYIAWLSTQDHNVPHEKGLADIEKMNRLRAPGGTCLSALSSGKMGTLVEPIHDSKGCGGVMRVAPIGFLDINEEEVLMLGARAAAITHGHPLGYIPSAMLSHIIYGIFNNANLSLKDIVLNSLSKTALTFKDNSYIPFFKDLIYRAVDLADSDTKCEEAIFSLGAGWVAEEALAIAVFCTLRYENDFEGCITAAVNHSGDSDSTGAIAGNILGAYLGFDSIPQKYIINLEMTDVLDDIAHQL